MSGQIFSLGQTYVAMNQKCNLTCVLQISVLSLFNQSGLLVRHKFLLSIVKKDNYLQLCTTTPSAAAVVVVIIIIIVFIV